MAASSYDQALRAVLAHEGGYTNNASDPGGPTNFGITIADYGAFKGRKVSAADVRAMTLAEAKAIYRKKYWDGLKCDRFAAGLDYALFDYGVNSGPARAAKVLQRLLGLSDDGIITDAVLAASRKRATKDLVARLCDERMIFLRGLKTWSVFGTGWSRRVADVRATALALAATSDPQRAPPAPAPGKAVVPAGAPASRVGGVFAAVGAAIAALIHGAGAHPAIVAVACAAAALAFGGWWILRARQKRQQEG